MKITVTFDVPNDNSWHKLSKKVFVPGKKRRKGSNRKTNKMYNCSVYLKSDGNAAEMYNMELENDTLKERN